MGEELISAAEAAILLGVSDRRVRQMAAFLHAQRDRMGKLWFDKAAVTEFAEVRRIQAHGLAAMRQGEAREERITALEVEQGILSEKEADLQQRVSELEARLDEVSRLLDAASSSSSDDE